MLVLIAEENKPRLQWPLGRVIELVPSTDGIVRTVRLKTQKGERIRPVQRLHLLEGATSMELDVLNEQSQMTLQIIKNKSSSCVIVTLHKRRDC